MMPLTTSVLCDGKIVKGITPHYVQLCLSTSEEHHHRI